MGQAKLRGSFEQRKAEALKLQRVQYEEAARKRAQRQIELREREAKMPPDEREKRQKRERLLTAALGIAEGSLVYRRE